jgi:hypothetical protein
MEVPAMTIGTVYNPKPGNPDASRLTIAPSPIVVIRR